MGILTAMRVIKQVVGGQLTSARLKVVRWSSSLACHLESRVQLLGKEL